MRAGLLVVPLLVFLWGGVVVYFTPNRYESQVLFEYTGTRPQAEVLKLLESGNVMEWAVRELDLVNKWGVDSGTAVRIAEGTTKTRVEPKSGLIEITVTSVKKETAKDLAQMLVKSLERYERSLADAAVDARIETGERLLVETGDEMVAKRQELSRLISMRGEKAADPLAQLDLDAARRDWDHAHQQVLDLRTRIAEMKRERANPVKWAVVHTQPELSQTPLKKDQSLEGAALNALVSGLVVAFAAPYFLELILPRRRRSAPEKDKWLDAPDGEELAAIPANG